MMIAVRVLPDLYRGLAAVGRSEQRRVLHVDDVLVAGIAEDVRVVERALPNRARGVDQLPRSTGIVRYEQATILVFDQRVDAIGVGLRVGETDAADHARRQPGVARDLGPRLAAVGRLIHAAAGAAARHLVFNAIRLPQRGIDHVRIVGVDHDIDGAAARILEQRALPRFAAIGALEHAALFARTVIQTECGDVDDVWIGWMDANLRDRVNVPESDVGPCFSSVCGFINAVARHDVAADTVLAHADEHDVGMRFRHRDRANRRAADLAIGHWRPRVPGVGGFPQAAANRAEIGLARAAFHAGHRNRSAAAIRADAAPPVSIE